MEILNFLRKKNEVQLELVKNEFETKRTHQRWKHWEIALIINAIEFCSKQGLKVNINLLSRFLKRSDSSIRNMILEYAGKLQYFTLETTNQPYKDIATTHSFLQFVVDPSRRVELINIFCTLCIFDKGTNPTIIKNFWISNKEGKLIWQV